MRHFVSGAGGFIGRHVVKWLEDKGHEVVRITSYSTITFLPVDKEFVFVHLAAYGNHYHQTVVSEIVKANITNLQAVLQLCKHENCRKLYNISTSSIQLPKQTLYSTSKHFGELMVESCNDERFVNIRPYSVYGPGEASHRFIPTVIRALRSGETIQLDQWANHDWIFIDSFIDAMFSGYTHIGTGVNVANQQIVDELELISGKKLNYEVSVGMRNYDTYIWRAEKGVPHIALKEGLKLTYERTP